MHSYNQHLHTLEAESHKGDLAARQRLRQELEREMVPKIREALRSGRGTCTLTRQALATARQLARYARPGVPAAEARERLVRRVASCLSECLVERMGGRPAPGRALKETVRM